MSFLVKPPKVELDYEEELRAYITTLDRLPVGKDQCEWWTASLISYPKLAKDILALGNAKLALPSSIVKMYVCVNSWESMELKVEDKKNFCSI